MRTVKICVIDGLRGEIGTAIITALKDYYQESVYIWGLGTNPIATCRMLNAGANLGDTGESAIARSVMDADVVMGSIAITWANTMYGEVTPAVAEAVMSSSAPKILIPMNVERVSIVGVANETLSDMVNCVVAKKFKEMCLHV